MRKPAVVIDRPDPDEAPVEETKMSALVASLDNGKAVLFKRKTFGGYHSVMKAQGLRLKWQRVKNGWAVWAERIES